MKGAIHQLTRLSLASAIALSSVIGATLGNGFSALALTEEQLLQKLRWVPMFVVTDADSGIVVSRFSNEAQESVDVVGVFVSPTDATAFLSNVQQENEEAQGFEIRALSLAEVYSLQQQSSESEEGPVFQFVPNAEDVDFAISVLQTAGQDISRDDFAGVPLFLGLTSEGGHISLVQEDNEEFFPVFFDAEAVQNMITQLEERNTELAGSLTVEVVNLQSVISTLEQSGAEEPTSRLELVPLAESIDYVRSLREAAGAENGTNDN